MDTPWRYVLLAVAALLLMTGLQSGGVEGGRSVQVDKAVKKALRNMAKASKPLRLPPSPPNNTRAPVTVGLDFDLFAVSDVNVNGGYVDLEGIYNMMWDDPRLTFDLPKAGKDIHVLRVNPKTIWTPDIQPYNGRAPGLQVFTSQPSATVSRSGNVFLSNNVKLRSTCDVIGQLSSGDVVNCTVKMGAWAYNGFEVQLSLSGAPSQRLGNQKPGGLWTATSAAAWLGQTVYPCCPEPYPYAQFSFLLRKRSLPHWLREKQPDA